VNEFFSKDIVIKIGSVLIGVLFWLYVSNATNPYISMTFNNVPIKIENENYLDDNGFMIKNKYKTSMDITIRGRQDAIAKVRPGDFEATLDFSQIKSVNDKVIKIIGPFCIQKDVWVESFSPEVIDIQLARYKNNTFPVQLVSNIALKPGYKVIKTSIDPASIPIAAEEALINGVDSIKAFLDLKDVDGDITKKVTCKVYNKDGKELTPLTSLISNINVNVSVEVAKEVPITVVIKGKPASDYVQTATLTTPATALITAPPDVLSKITDIKTEQIDISNLTQSKAINTVLNLPDGVKLANTANTSKNVVVNITIEKLEARDISIAKSDIGMLNKVVDGSLNYEIKTENPTVQLKGRQADLNSIKPEIISPTIDVGSLGEGTHKLLLNINLPSQVKLMQDVYVEVKITKAEQVQ
jgi:YbbR domain-containing protein